jgi:hypothetical protein
MYSLVDNLITHVMLEEHNDGRMDLCIKCEIKEYCPLIGALQIGFVTLGDEFDLVEDCPLFNMLDRDQIIIKAV